MGRKFQSMCRLFGVACVLTLCAAPAVAQNCAELGPRYTMYTYTGGNRAVAKIEAVKKIQVDPDGEVVMRRAPSK